MQVVALAIPEVKLITPRRFADERGVFSETYNRRALLAAGIDETFVQDNHSRSTERGTVRGLHFQIPPRAQAKLLQVLRGSIFDVAVDLRRDRPSFGRHIAAVLDAGSWTQIFIPAGFAHGFCTLEPETEVLYKVSEHYAPDHERGLLWNDPALGIAWPIRPEEAVVAARDAAFPPLAALPDDSVFRTSHGLG